MDRVLLLPGDGHGPSIIDSVRQILEVVTDRTEIVVADIGFSAYEKTGQYIPLDVLDLIDDCGTVICGPMKDYVEGGTIKNPMDTLKIRLDLYAIVRRFITLADDRGVPGMDVTLWASDIALGRDITETEDIDGISIGKYIRSSSFSRMMGKALSDLEMSGKDRVACVTRDDIFPESSAMFSDAFDSLFDSGRYKTPHMNIQKWASDIVRHPLDYDYVVCADLYSHVAAGILAGLSGGNHLSPIGFVGDAAILLVPGLYKTFADVPPGSANPTSAIVCGALALSGLGMRSEAESVLDALAATYGAGDRTPDMDGDLTTQQFTDKVLSRI